MPKPIAKLCVSPLICIATTHVFTNAFVHERRVENFGFSSFTRNLAIQCPDDITVQVSDIDCFADVVIPPPASDDLNCPIISLSNSLTGPSDPSGVYSAQILQITWTVEDDCGQNLQCLQNVHIVDETLPLLTCPPDITTGNSDDGRNIMVSVDSPLASDYCMLGWVLNDFNDTPDASVFYPVGSTLVTWTALDTSGNASACQMSVIVFDNTPPEIFCPDEEIFDCLDEIPLPFETYEAFELAGGNAIDETSLDTSGFSLLEESSDGMFCPETITRVYVISDEAGNTATCSQEFIIHDDEVPVIPSPTPLDDIACDALLPSPQT